MTGLGWSVRNLTFDLLLAAFAGNQVGSADDRSGVFANNTNDYGSGADGGGSRLPARKRRVP